MTYTAPTQDMKFVLDHIVGLDELNQIPDYAELSDDLVEAVLTEAGRLAGEVWAPINEFGDQTGSKLEGQDVKTPAGFKQAYTEMAEGGWVGLQFAEDHGGQNLPWALSIAVNEMWQASNLALSLCPLLSQAAIEAIEEHGSDELKHKYLPKLISGEWTGSMNLTEPQAGTDLSAIKTTAKKEGDHYRLKGQKIFITWGEHDFTENIIHLVLAHIDGMPDGNDGLGLFVVPKFLVNDDGSLGERNDLHAVSLEHKLGIHGSPTCIMSYGDNEGSKAWLVGAEGAGLKNMFTMMNNARIGVGVQGVAMCDRAYQHALEYAKERVQGPRLGDKDGTKVAIIEHPDVRRMLLTMKTYAEAGRALSYYAGAMLDVAKKHPDAEKAKSAQERVDLLTPLVKGWCTDLAVEVASMGVQVHGGMGFIEETGAAQFYRDARILPIYEGTNGIQAMDLVFRKLLRDGGQGAKRFIAEMREEIAGLTDKPSDDLDVIHQNMGRALDALEQTTGWMLENAKANTDALAAGAVHYQRQFATVAGGYVMAKSALAAHEQLGAANGHADWLKTKLLTARFFAEGLLPQVEGLMAPIMGGHGTTATISNDQF